MQSRHYELFLVEDIVNSSGHLIEQKLGSLANSKEDFEGKAYNIEFTPNVNGLKKLEFSLPVYYTDSKTGESVLNPRYRHITNERKVRLFFDDKYHDLVIKNVSEGRDENLLKIIKVVCEDAIVEELSKTGWALNFDEENGMGTIQELVPKCLVESDWVFDIGRTDKFFETEYINKDGIPNTSPGASQDAHMVSYNPVYGTQYHYWGDRAILGLPWANPNTVEVIKHQELEFIQSEVGRNYLSNGYSFYNISNWIAEKNNITVGTNDSDTNYSRFLQVKNNELFYNNSLDQKAFKFSDRGNYSFCITVKDNPTMTMIIEIGDNYGVTLNQVARAVITIPASSQWKTYGFQFKPPTTGHFNRVFIKTTASVQYKIGKVRVEQGGLNAILNSDFAKSANYWNFINNPSTNNQHQAVLKNYDFRATVLKTDKIIQTAQATTTFKNVNRSDVISISLDGKTDGGDATVRCIFQGWKSGSLDQQEITLKLQEFWSRQSGLILPISATNYDTVNLQIIPSKTVYLTNIKLEQGAHSLWTPALEDEIAQYLFSPVADYISSDFYKYYENGKEIILNLTEGQIRTLIPRIEIPQKIRTLVGEKSNVFNWLQTICELFEGWITYEVQYDKNGLIAKDKNGRRIKKLYFKQEVGKDLPYGIEYGLNLKGITRTIQSTEIVTKMFVENNEFEYAENGIVSIAQSPENPSKESYIINFDYYVEMGLLSQNAIVDLASFNADMYRLNELLDRNIALRNRLQTEVSQLVIPQLEILTFKEIALASALREIDDQLTQALPTMDLEGLKAQKINYQQQLADATVAITELKKKKASYDTQITQLVQQITSYLKQKAIIVKDFNGKYATYLKEGVWQDDNYLYPVLFYRDAVEVAKRSSQPKVSYDISVIDLSWLDEYGHLRMNVGDKTFVRDTELFLIKADNDFKQKDLDVFISEITYTLDNPERVNIKVQNFNSRFDDIFERVVASTESLKLNEKVYDRAANFQSDQTINVDILQKSLLENNLIIARSKDDTVIFDNQGITVSDGQNPNRKVKIVSGGIFITKDGINYKAGITPDGVAIDQLTAGLIDTKNIQIWNALEPRFLWDANGLVAYGLDRNNRTDFNSKIIFNHEGLIFKRNINQAAAELSLTWDGLAINLQDGAVKIGSGAGIVIEDNQTTPVRRVEIGKINKLAGESETFSKDNPLSTPIYGMVLRNSDNLETLVTSDTGELWLRRAISVGDKGGQDMAGISGITQYSQREIQNYIRNQQYWHLAEAQQAGDQTEIDKWTLAISKPIPSAEFVQFKQKLESDPIRFYSGSNAPTKASFRVYQSGLLFATNAHIEGDISAWSGHFKGRVYVGTRDDNGINTGSGISGLVGDKVRFWAGSPFITGSDNESYPEDGLFKVYNDGKVFATNMDVHGLMTAGRLDGNGDYVPTLFIAGTDYWYSGVLHTTSIPANLRARFWVGGFTPNSANLVITEDGGFYGADVHVSGKIEGAGLKVAKININDSGIYTDNFTPGVMGFGWMIANDGTANFNNVNVRGELSTVIFKKNEMQVAGGNILVRPTTALKNDYDFTGKLNQSVIFKTEAGNYFAIGDFIVLKEELSRIVIQVTATNNDEVTGIVRELSAGNVAMLQGAPVINFGKTGNAGILLSASGNTGMNMTDGAVIDMTETKIVANSLTEKMRLRIGDLSNLPDAELPSGGYGLYADNVALRGNLFLPNAGMYSGDETSGGENKVIRIWTGTPFNQRHDANFKVYADGTVLARGGIFEGKIIASEGGFSGSVGLAGITINDNTGSFYIQKRQGNTENFNTIAMFSSDGITIYDGGIRIFKSLADQSQPKPNTFQYLYPYMMANNNTAGNNERIIMRKTHFWSFEPETATNFVNYSIRTNKLMWEYATETLANQDKAQYTYSLTNFTGTGNPAFIQYINDTSKVTLERTTSYLGIKQLDNTTQNIMKATVSNYKTISGASNDRRYELSIEVMMEYPDNEDAYLTLTYTPVRGGATPEILKFNLPVLKNTWTTLFKEISITGYNAENPFTFTIGVENSTSATEPINNRLIVRKVFLEETTSTAFNAEELAFGMTKRAQFGMSSASRFEWTLRDGCYARLQSMDAAGTYTNNTRLGINKNPEHPLDVAGVIRGGRLASLADVYAGSYLQSATHIQSGSYIQGAQWLRSYNGGTNHVILQDGYINVVKGDATQGYISIQSGNSPGAWTLSSYLRLYNHSQADLRFYLGATRGTDSTGGIAGTFPLVGIVSNGTGNGTFAASGDLLAYRSFRVPIIRSSTGTPSNGWYPNSAPKVGDIWIRYV